jgi:hypothetical protein
MADPQPDLTAARPQDAGPAQPPAALQADSLAAPAAVPPPVLSRQRPAIALPAGDGVVPAVPLQLPGPGEPVPQAQLAGPGEPGPQAQLVGRGEPVRRAQLAGPSEGPDRHPATDR